MSVGGSLGAGFGRIAAFPGIRNPGRGAEATSRWGAGGDGTGRLDKVAAEEVPDRCSDLKHSLSSAAGAAVP